VIIIIIIIIITTTNNNNNNKVDLFLMKYNTRKAQCGVVVQT